ncbi:MAG: hypothetical protein AAGI70_08035 [Pseudomonadota bacterium]
MTQLDRGRWRIVALVPLMITLAEPDLDHPKPMGGSAHLSLTGRGRTTQLCKRCQ